MSDESAALLDLGRVLDLMIEKVGQFHALLSDEQQAIRTLSFGQFSDVTEKKSELLVFLTPRIMSDQAIAVSR